MPFWKVRKYQILLVITPLIIFFDQLTKELIVNYFDLHESIPIIEDYFNLTFIRNTGAAFGILAGANPTFRVPFFFLVPLVALVFIIAVLRKLPAENVLVSSALALVVGGAIGNLIDRVRYGSVVDFLDFHWRNSYHFPAFNVADSAICVGVALLMLDLVVGKDHKSELGAA